MDRAKGIALCVFPIGKESAPSVSQGCRDTPFASPHPWSQQRRCIGSPAASRVRWQHRWASIEFGAVATAGVDDASPIGEVSKDSRSKQKLCAGVGLCPFSLSAPAGSALWAHYQS